MKILLSLNGEIFLHVVHENFEVKASTNAVRSTENATLFDDQENNPIGMSKTRLIYKLITTWNWKLISYM